MLGPGEGVHELHNGIISEGTAPSSIWKILHRWNRTCSGERWLQFGPSPLNTLPTCSLPTVMFRVPWHDMQAFLHLATIFLSSWSFYAYVLPTKPNWLPFLTQGTLLALCLWKSCLYSLHSSSPQILLLICQEPAQMPQPVWSFSVCSKLTVDVFFI